MKRGKKRTNDAIRDVVVTDNVMGIISEGNAYVLREKIPTLVMEMGETEDGYVLSQESEEYLKEQKMLFEKRRNEFRNRQEDNDFLNLIDVVSWDFCLISMAVCLFCAFQIFLLSASCSVAFIAFGFFMIGYCATVSDKMLNLVNILSSGLEKEQARKIAAIHKAINAYKEKGEIPNIKEVEEADRTPSIKCNASVQWRLGINLILFGCILNIIDTILYTSNVVPIIILIVVVLVYLTRKQEIYNWEIARKMLTPSEKEISEAIKLLEFFEENQKNSSTK